MFFKIYKLRKALFINYIRRRSLLVHHLDASIIDKNKENLDVKIKAKYIFIAKTVQ